MKFIQILADLIRSVLSDPEILDRCRARKGAFTRDRGKLSYWNVIKLLLMDSKNTYSATLDQFFSDLAKSIGPFKTRFNVLNRLSARPGQTSSLTSSACVSRRCVISCAPGIPMLLTNYTPFSSSIGDTLQKK